MDNSTTRLDLELEQLREQEPAEHYHRDWQTHEHDYIQASRVFTHRHEER